MSSLWINLCSTDEVFSQFYERGREHWEAAVIKLGTQVLHVRKPRSASNWGMPWTQQNVQGPLTHPTANTHSSVRCLQLIGMSETPKGEVLLIFFPRSKGNFHLTVTCKCQDCTLKLYSCLCWEVQRVFSYTSHLSSPRHDVRIKSCLANDLCHTLACKVLSQQQRWCGKENSSDIPAPHHLSGKAWEIFQPVYLYTKYSPDWNVRRQLLPTWSCQLLKRLLCQDIGTRISVKELHWLWVQLSYIPMVITPSWS